MIKSLKSRVFLLLMAGISLAGMTGCDDQDVMYDKYSIPEVDLKPTALSGVITAKSGAPLVGATVTLGDQTTVTDAQGVYRFDDVKSGKYKITAVAANHETMEGEIVVSRSDNATQNVWNALLGSSNVKSEAPAKSKVSQRIEMVTESLQDNDLAKIKIIARIPANSVRNVSSDAKIVLAPNDVKLNLIDGEKSTIVLVGTELKCTDSRAKLSKPVQLEFVLDPVLAKIARPCKLKKNKKGENEWVPVKYTTRKGVVRVKADEFTTYGFIVRHVVMHLEQISKEPLKFKPNIWDNLYGTEDIVAPETYYTYKAGVKIRVINHSVLDALMKEQITIAYGGIPYQEVAGVFPLNTVVPVGTILTVHGFQYTYKAIMGICVDEDLIDDDDDENGWDCHWGCDWECDWDGEFELEWDECDWDDFECDFDFDCDYSLSSRCDWECSWGEVERKECEWDWDWICGLDWGCCGKPDFGKDEIDYDDKRFIFARAIVYKHVVIYGEADGHQHNGGSN